MLLDDYDRIARAPTKEALRDALAAFAEHMDFPIVTGQLVIDHARGSTFVTVSNMPAASLPVFEAVEEAHRDPVMQHLKTRNTPIVWNQKTYVDANVGEMWEVQAPFGFRTGIGLALHLPMGRHFVLAMDRDKPLPQRDAKLTRLVADLHLLAVHAQDAALRLLLPPPDPLVAHAPLLTARELEILRWLVQGKTTPVIAQILRVSEHTVGFHLKNLYRKLDCDSRSTAIVKAMNFGLL